MGAGALGLTISEMKYLLTDRIIREDVNYVYLEGEAGVDLLEAALARILEEELLLLPSCERKLRLKELQKRIIQLKDE